MLYPIQFTSNTTNKKQEKHAENQSAKKYQDPLNKNWMVGLSFSNELGAAVYEISPRLSQILWVPPLMYLGADIYDKYKNDKNSYNPSGERAVEQAIYQGLSGFVLPTCAILAGQKITSPIGKVLNKGLSVNTKKATIKHINYSIDQCVGDIFKDKDKFKNFFLNSLENKIRACQNEKFADPLWKKIIKQCSGKYALANCKKSKIMDYAEENVERLIKIKEDLQANKKPPEISSKNFKRYMREYPVLKETYGDLIANNAMRYTLKTYENKLLFGNKLLKTIGGLVALVLSIKPIDTFVKKVVMPKYIDPGIDKFNKALLETSTLKKHINNNTEKKTA